MLRISACYCGLARGHVCVCRGGHTGAHLREADVRRDPVTNGEGHDVSGNEVSCEQVLERPLPGAVLGGRDRQRADRGFHALRLAGRWW